MNARLQEYVKSSSGKYETVPSEICEEEDLNLIYIRIVGQYGEEMPYETAWNKLMKFLKEKQALSAATRFIGLSFDDPNVTIAGQCRFYACATVDKPIEAAGVFGTLRLRKGRYAVYTLKGSYSNLQEFYNNISISFNHTIRHGMPFEEYIHYTGTDSEATLTKIYIPIK